MLSLECSAKNLPTIPAMVRGQEIPLRQWWAQKKDPFQHQEWGESNGAVCWEGPGPRARISAAGCRHVGRLLPVITLFISFPCFRLSHRFSWQLSTTLTTVLSTALPQIPYIQTFKLQTFKDPITSAGSRVWLHCHVCVACTRGCAFVYFTVQCSREDSSTTSLFQAQDVWKPDQKQEYMAHCMRWAPSLTSLDTETNWTWIQSWKGTHSYSK